MRLPAVVKFVKRTLAPPRKAPLGQKGFRASMHFIICILNKHLEVTTNLAFIV